MQRDARISNVALARAVGLAPSAALARVRKLERIGIIRGYAATLSRAALQQGVLAFVAIRTSELPRRAAAAAALAGVPEVLELHDVAGEDCYLAKVVAGSVAELHDLVRTRIGTIRHVRGTKTTIVMKTYKETTAIPLRGAAAAQRRKRSEK